MLYTRSVTLTSTSEGILFTVPNGYVARVTYVIVSNHGGSTNACTLYWNKASGTDLYLIDGKNISSKDYIIFSDIDLVLEEGDSFRAQTGSAGDVGTACTFDLIPKPNVFINFNGS